MGHLVFLASIADLADTAPLHDLPASMPWRAFRMPDGRTVVEWVRRRGLGSRSANPVVFPDDPLFAVRPSGIDLPDKLGDAAPGFDALYASLEQRKLADTIPKVAISSTLRISALCDRPVIGIASDDEDWDLACQCRSGRLDQLTFLAGTEVVTLEGNGTIATVSAPEQRIIHHIAQRAAASWSDALDALFGFDGDATVIGLMEVDRSSSPPPVADARLADPDTAPPGKQPFWRRWL